jgi:hypothetical protein
MPSALRPGGARLELARGGDRRRCSEALLAPWLGAIHGSAEP